MRDADPNELPAMDESLMAQKGPAPAAPKAKRRAWPPADDQWTPEDDWRAFRRFGRLLESIPSHALPRCRAYLIEMLNQERLL